ncbi:MAG: hypothetical protein ACTSRS_09255 [Candidatus Helarchaeota archaeon]
MSVKAGKEFYVFDANFFITIRDIHSPNFFEMLKRARNLLQWEFFISERVFREIKHIYYSQKQSKIFQAILTVKRVADTEIEQLKATYKKSHLIPQDPDLSLAMLAKSLKSTKNEGYIISDDFKLSEFVEKVQKVGIKVLSCGAFLLKVAKNLPNPQMKRFFLKLRRAVERAEIEYVLERKDIYPAHQKLSWLIERAINVSEEHVNFQETIQECYDEEDAEERVQREIWLAHRVLLGENLTKKYKKEIAPLIPLLEELIELRKAIKIAHQYLTSNQAVRAMDLLKEVERTLTNLYFAEKAKFITHHTPEILLADELARSYFLHAITSVQIAGIPEAKRFFDNTILFGLAARKKGLVLMAMLLNALIFVFSNRWDVALEQYRLVAQVSKDFGDEQIELKSLLGMSIVQFLSGKYPDAMKNLTSIRKLLNKNHKRAPLILEEFGDIFYALGMTDYALTIYQEALEYQLELGMKTPPNAFLEKIRKCFLIQGIRTPEITKEFSDFMDSLHHLEGKYFEKYDKVMAKIFEINKLLYEPFPIFTRGEKRLQELKIDGIFDWLDIIDIEMSEHNDTILIVYSPKLGLLGIQIFESSLTLPIPENYRVRFKKDSAVLIQEPSSTEQEKYLIRALIQIDTDLELEIERRIPKIYEKLLSP